MNKQEAIRLMVREGNTVWRDDLKFEEFELYVSEDIIDDDFTFEDYQGLHYPMWGAMFNFKNIDEESLRILNGDITQHKGIDFDELFLDTGLIAFMSPSGEIWFGINGAGYDFYEHHWAKLFDYMGYMWHSEE